MSKTILFLTCRMKFGYGVDVVVHQMAKALQARGVRVIIGCEEFDQDFADLQINYVPPNLHDVRRLAHLVLPDAIVAHSSPFFEMLPALQRQYRCWAWEHGDPSPEFFDIGRAEREQTKDYKRQAVYAKIQGVVAISEFIRHEIGFLPAHVVYSGCDHTPWYDSKSNQDIVAGSTRPLRVGTLMRLGQGEAQYKGNALFRQFCAAVHAAQINAEFCVMGRGTQADAEPFAQANIRTYLNGSAHDKWRYLRGLDVFFTCSLWEGFNLPLVEAQAVGTLGMAFDTGAHPEVTPFVVGSVDDAVALVHAYANNRALLLRHAHMGWRFARGQFSWARTVDALEALLLAEQEHRRPTPIQQQAAPIH